MLQILLEQLELLVENFVVLFKTKPMATNKYKVMPLRVLLIQEIL